MRWFNFLALVVVAAPVSAATVNKCVGPDGKVLFTQAACPESHGVQQIDIAPANGMNNSANHRLGPPADKYVKPLDLSGSSSQQINRIKAVVDIGVMKARDCNWALKVDRNPAKCMDLLAYMVEGSTYNQAMGKAASLTQQEIAENALTLQSIVRAAEEINQAKELALAYASTP